MSRVVQSICKNPHTVTELPKSIKVEFKCSLTPPFFEGHDLFLEPKSMLYKDGYMHARFERNTGKIIFSDSHLKRLIEIFRFFESNNVHPGSYIVQSFISQGG